MLLAKPASGRARTASITIFLNMILPRSRKTAHQAYIFAKATHRRGERLFQNCSLFASTSEVTTSAL